MAICGTICCLLLAAALLLGIYTGTNVFKSDDDEIEVTKELKRTYAPVSGRAPASPGSGPSKPADETLPTQVVAEPSETPSTQPQQTQKAPSTQPQPTQPAPSSRRNQTTATASSSGGSGTTVMSVSGPPTTKAMTSQANTSPSAAASALTILPASATTSKRPGLHRFTTVCTVSYLHIGLMVPPGDVCNYLFYDALYARPEDTFMGTLTNDYLKPFFNAARQNTKQHFGFSVHAPAVEGFTNEIRSDPGKKHYKDHWQHNVYGWGFLNIHELIVNSNPDVVKSALTVLKELEEIAVAEKNNGSNMIIGLYCRPHTTCNQVADYLKTIFVPGGLVVLGHISHRDNNITDCVILGPTTRNITGRKYANTSYVHTLGDAMGVVRYLQKDKGIDTMYAVSFTMAGRWYQPKNPDNQNQRAGKYRPGNPCKLGDYPQKAFVPEVCDNTSLSYKSTFYYAAFDSTVFAYDKVHGFSVTVENPESIRRKICNTWDSNTDLLTGLAVYDANYDAAAKNCSPYKGAAWEFLKRFGSARDVLNAWGDKTGGNFTGGCYSLN